MVTTATSVSSTSFAAADAAYAKPSLYDVPPTVLTSPPTYPYTISRILREVYPYESAAYNLATVGDKVTLQFTGITASENQIGQYLPYGLWLPKALGNRDVDMLPLLGATDQFDAFRASGKGSLPIDVTSLVGGNYYNLSNGFPTGWTTASPTDVLNVEIEVTQINSVFRANVTLWLTGNQAGATVHEIYLNNVENPGSQQYATVVIGNSEGIINPFEGSSSVFCNSVARCQVLAPTFVIA